MKFKNIEELLEYLTPDCDQEELERINEEIAYFKKQGWIEYILFLAEIVPCLYNEPAVLRKSAMDSYLLRKCIIENRKDEELLNNVHSKEILFNDALRLNIDIVSPLFALAYKVFNSDKLIYNALMNHSFHKYERFIDSNSEYLILSNKELSHKEIDTIIEEKKDDNDPILKEVLIIRYRFQQGI